MYTKGSITVFFALLLSIMISLISTMLLSAKVAAGRVQISLAVDQAIFSAMAKYDRQLFEEYHLFYIDGGYGTGTLQLGKAIAEIESDLSYLLTPNKDREILGGESFLQLEKTGGAITGYTLATDCNGGVFREQVVSYMEDTLGLQGISLLAQKLLSQKEIIQSQERFLEKNKQKGTLQDYEDIKTEAAEIKRQKEEAKNAALQENIEVQTGAITQENGFAEETAIQNAISEETKKTAEQAEEVLDTISVLKETSVLNLVLPNPQTVSGWTGNEETLLSKRSLQTGMGYLELTQEESVVTDLLFQEYMLQNLNYFQNEKCAGGPSYAVEWVLFGQLSDMENLEAMAGRLLLIREAANVASICMDDGKMSQVQILAEALATVLEMPYIMHVLEGALVIAWAFAESLVDVRALFDGESVALIKDDDTWQVSLGEIMGALQNPEAYYQENGGMSYEDYLRIFLMFRSEQDKLNGCMEVIEQSMREIPGKEQFSMDCAIDALEVEFQIRSQNIITFDITRKESYRTI